MIYVRWARKGQPPALIEIEEGRDPFEICAKVEQELGLKPKGFDPAFERIMAARRRESGSRRT